MNGALRQIAPHIAEFTVARYLSGKRIDTFLTRELRNYTPFRMQRLVAAGHVSIDDTIADNERRVHTGQRVRIRLIEPPDKLFDAEELPLEIVYEDDWLLVVNKPPDQVAHPAGSIHSGTLANGLQLHLDAQSPLPGLLRPGIVHRLDRFTSGLMVVSKDHLTHRRLSMQFQQRRVSKSYLALVEGVVDCDSGTIDLPIGSVPCDDFTRMSAQPDAREPRTTQTEFTVIERFAKHTLVEAKPLTGRLHQIRVHMAVIGCPIVHDEFYGAFGEVKLLRREGAVGIENSAVSRVAGTEIIDRQALHAHRLGFEHPMTGAQVAFEAELPNDMQRAIERAGKPSVAVTESVEPRSGAR